MAVVTVDDDVETAIPLCVADGSLVDLVCISKPVVAVLPDEGMSLSFAPSSPGSGGDTNRAVGRSPVASGLRDFFKMGCEGGGLDALDDRLLIDASFDFNRGAFGRSCVESTSRCRCATMSCLVNAGTLGPSQRLGGPWRGTKVGPTEMSS